MYRVLNSESCVVSTRASRSRVLLLSSILFYFRNFDVAEWLVEIFRYYRVCLHTQVEQSFWSCVIRSWEMELPIIFIFHGKSKSKHAVILNRRQSGFCQNAQAHWC
jgi:hypothetical protein